MHFVLAALLHSVSVLALSPAPALASVQATQPAVQDAPAAKPSAQQPAAQGSTLATQAAPQPAAQSAPPPAPAPSDLTAPVPGTKLTVHLDVPGYTGDERHARALKQALGPRGVFVGVLPAEGSNLELVIDKEPEKQPHMTDAQWRDFNLKDAGAAWKYFEGAGFLCGEASIFFEGSGSHDFHAFAVRAGQRIDLHMSESFDATRKPRLSRPKFLEVASTFRLAALRCGAWSDQPPQVIDTMDRALQAADARDQLADLAKASPADYAIPLAAAELSVAFDRPAAEAIEGYSKAIEILAAKKEPDAVERFALVLGEEGLGLALSETKDREKSVAQFDNAQKLAVSLPARIRSAILVDRARAEARFGRAETALEHLQEAEKIEHGAILIAIHDKDLAPVRELPWFKNFLAGDR
jgi:tetratricopeptide (TPR) repeat protein